MLGKERGTLRSPPHVATPPGAWQGSPGSLSAPADPSWATAGIWIIVNGSAGRLGKEAQAARGVEAPQGAQTWRRSRCQADVWPRNLGRGCACATTRIQGHLARRQQPRGQGA